MPEIQRKTKHEWKNPKAPTAEGGPKQERKLKNVQKCNVKKCKKQKCSFIFLLLQIAQDFSLLFDPETSSKHLEKWHTFYKERWSERQRVLLYYHPSAPEFAEICQESGQRGIFR